MRNHVVIDAGHGGSAPAGSSSAFGVRGPAGALEKDVTLALAQRVAAHYGSEVVLTRSADVNLPLGERSAVAQRLGAPVFVSLHANAGPSGARGGEAYVHERATARSLSLADCIQRELGTYGHAVAPVSRESLAVLAPDRLPADAAACLLEVDYLSDPHGERRLTDPSQLDRLGAAIARGIRRYMGSQPAVAEGQEPATIIGIIGLGIAAFGLINALESRNVGGLTWSRNITKAIHTYGPGQTPATYYDLSEPLLRVDGISGFSSAWALFTLRYRCNGNDIDQCRVEITGSSDWDSSLLNVTFEGSDAASYEESSIGAIAVYLRGTVDPAGAGDIDFRCRALVKANGTVSALEDLSVTRGDASAFQLATSTDGYLFLIRKR
jgi:N-acetylmuramoyl-L-alanine amidase